MKAMILCAGLGSRLGELAQKTPKPLVQAGGKPMLYYIINNLKSCGVNSIIINLHHLQEQIVDYIKENNNFNIDIQFSYEEQLLGTGGALLKVQDFFKDEPCFLLHNCDVYCELDLNDLLTKHKNSNTLATLSVMKPKTSRTLIFDKEETLCGWSNSETEQTVLAKQTDHESHYDFCCIHCISNQIFPYLADCETNEAPAFSIITAYLDAVKNGQNINYLDIKDSYWVDMGSPEKLKELDTYLSNKDL